jgi:TRAP-type C4-dicarboxylate transport system permease small subunit
MDFYVRAVTFLSKVFGLIAAALIASGVLVVCHMVFVRYVLNQNTIWQTDFTTYCLVAATFIGSPYLLLSRGHVNVDVVPYYLGPKGRFWLALVTALVSFGFCAVMTYLTYQFWLEAWDNDWVSDTMWRARLWIPYAAMPIGLGLLSLQYIASIYNLITGREPPFGMTEGQRGGHA